ncbi:hypothetical protein FACS18948_3000 [Clostridia bacterium]|nr:hypothetical protein FACS18948_3000 [Clostridia bacterium]
MRQRFRAAREAKGLTQEQLASLVGVKRTAICKIEAGTRKPSLDVALRLERILGRSARYLLTQEPQKTA